MASFDDFRARFPGARDLSDVEIANRLSQYTGMPVDSIASQLGVKRNSGLMGDIGTGLKRGFEQIPGSITGLEDAPAAALTGERPITEAANWVGRQTGFRPGRWAQDAELQYSPEMQRQREAVDKAWNPSWEDVMDGRATWPPKASTVAGAYLQNPRAIVDTIAESAPSMVTGGLGGRMLAKAGSNTVGRGLAGPNLPGTIERTVGTRYAAPVAAGMGEGAVTTGQQIDQYDGPDQQRNALAAFGAGMTTGTIGFGAGRLANRMGLETAETAIVGGRRDLLSEGMSLPRRLGAGAVSEGLMQEFPQSYTEQMWQNYGSGQPLFEGAMRAGVEGGMAGGAMGASFNLSNRARRDQLAAGVPTNLLDPVVPPDQESPLQGLRTDTIPTQDWVNQQLGIGAERQPRADATAAFTAPLQTPVWITDEQGNPKLAKTQWELYDFQNRTRGEGPTPASDVQTGGEPIIAMPHQFSGAMPAGTGGIEDEVHRAAGILSAAHQVDPTDEQFKRDVEWAHGAMKQHLGEKMYQQFINDLAVAVQEKQKKQEAVKQPAGQQAKTSTPKVPAAPTTFGGLYKAAGGRATAMRDALDKVSTKEEALDLVRRGLENTNAASSTIKALEQVHKDLSGETYAQYLQRQDAAGRNVNPTAPGAVKTYTPEEIAALNAEQGHSQFANRENQTNSGASNGNGRQVVRADQGVQATGPVQGASVPARTEGTRLPAKGGQEQRALAVKELVSGLSDQDQQIMGFMADGLSSTEIGTRLGISRQAVEQRINGQEGRNRGIRGRLLAAAEKHGVSIKDLLNGPRIVRESDNARLGLSPKLNESKFDEANLGGGEENAVEQSSGVISSAGGSQGQTKDGNSKGANWLRENDPTYKEQRDDTLDEEGRTEDTPEGEYIPAAQGEKVDERIASRESASNEWEAARAWWDGERDSDPNIPTFEDLADGHQEEVIDAVKNDTANGRLWRRIVEEFKNPPDYYSRGRGLTEDELHAPGVQRAIGELNDAGMLPVLDRLDSVSIVEDQESDGAYYDFGGKRPARITLSSALMKDTPAQVAHVLRHEVSHEIDRLGGYSQDQVLEMDEFRRPVGRVAAELHALFERGTVLGRYLAYPFSEQHVDLNAEDTQAEVFAQLQAAWMSKFGRELIQREAPRAAAFLREVNADAKVQLRKGQGGTTGQTAGRQGEASQVARASARGDRKLDHPAFHGSPHIFDRFTVQKIGTGEGAQAYGWGMYFAGKKAVAQWYRDNLARNTSGRTEYTIYAPLAAADLSKVAALADERITERKGRGEIHKGKTLKANVVEVLKERNADSGLVERVEALPDDVFALTPRKAGRLYHVELAPKEDEYLDWDNTVPTDKLDKIPAETRSKIEEYLQDHQDLTLDELTGAELYRTLVRYASEAPLLPDAPLNMREHEEASKFLLSIGIPGIKYLDGSSRRAHANPVISEIPGLSKINGKRVVFEGVEYVSSSSSEVRVQGGSHPMVLVKLLDSYSGSDEWAPVDRLTDDKQNALLSDQDLLDALFEVKQFKPQGHHNYVIFDDSLVEITGYENRGKALSEPNRFAQTPDTQLDEVVQTLLQAKEKNAPGSKEQLDAALEEQRRRHDSRMQRMRENNTGGNTLQSRGSALDESVFGGFENLSLEELKAKSREIVRRIHAESNRETGEIPPALVAQQDKISSLRNHRRFAATSDSQLREYVGVLDELSSLVEGDELGQIDAAREAVLGVLHDRARQRGTNRTDRVAGKPFPPFVNEGRKVLHSRGRALAEPQVPTDISEELQPSQRILVDAIKDTLTNWGKKGLQAVVFAQDLVDIAVKEGLTTARGFFDLLNEKAAKRLHFEAEVDRIMTDAANLTDRTMVNKFLQHSTRAGKWGYVPTWKQGITADPALAAEYNRLSDAGKKVVDAVFRYGDQTYAELQTLVNKEINDEFDARDAAARTPEEKTQVAKDRASKLRMMGRTLPKLQGPYAPLKRFGDYVSVAKSAAYRDAEAREDRKWIADNQDNPNHYRVEFYDTIAEAKARARQLAPFFAHTDGFEKQKVYRDIQELPWGAISRVKHAIEDLPDATKAKSALSGLVTDLYLTMLSESSARKAELNRKGIYGEDRDMLRSFASQGRANSYFISALQHNGRIAEQITAMQKEAAQGRAGTREDRSRVFNEIMARYAQGLDYRPTPLADKAMRLTSFWMLLTTPSYYLQNMTQPFMLTIPVLGGRFGAGRAWDAMFKAYKDAGKYVSKMDHNLDLNRLPISEDERAMLRRLRDTGRIDLTIAQDLGRWSRGGDTSWVGRQVQKATPRGKAVFDKVFDVVTRQMPQKSEALNRVVTALAAYRLSGGNMEYTARALDQTQGNYAPSNAPRAFNANGFTKMVGQFRKFQLIQISLLGRLVNDAFRGATPEERAVGFHALKWILAHHMVMAGALGLPLANVVGFLIASMFGDDDEPKDFERMAREAIGDETLANLILNGVPTLAGLNLTNRIGMGNAFSILPFTDIDFTSKDGYLKTIAGAAGPFFGGLGVRMADGLNYMRKGDYYKGAETMMPRGVSDVMKAFRLANKGVTMKNGDTVMTPDELSTYDVLMQGIGLPTMTLTDRSRRASDLYEMETYYKDRTSTIRHKYAEAYRENDTEEMKDLREEWDAVAEAMKRNGFKPSPLSSLLKAPHEQAKRESQVVRGVETRKGNRQAVEINP